MYVCGPTVYQRAHIGNAVPFVIFAWLRNWLRERGYDVTYVHNITDVNDKIYEAAPGASAARAREATQWYLDDTRSFGLEMPDEQPLATETIPEIVALIEELIAVGSRVRGRGRRLLPGRELRELRRALGSAPRPGRGAGAEPAQGGSARLRALEGDQGGRGHVLGLPVGAGQAGLAHRVLGDGGEDARARVPDPRRWARPRLPASRERARAVAGRRPSVREDLDAQRPAPLHGREDVEVRRQRRHDPGGDRRVGPRGGAALPDDRALAQAARVLGRGDDRGRRAGREPAQRAPRRDTVGGRLGRACRRSRRRLQHAGSARDLPPLGARGGARRAAARSRRVRARRAG